MMNHIGFGNWPFSFLPQTRKLTELTPSQVMSKFNAATVQKITNLKDKNHHTEAYLLGAKMMGYTELAKKFDLINQLVKLEGHNPIRTYEYELYQALLASAKTELSPKEYLQFYSAF